MTDELKRTAPVDTGLLKRKTGVSVTSAEGSTIKAEAVADTDYAEVVVQGSKPHVIRPRRGRALRFYWPKAGAVVYFSKVNHPGTAPNPFFDRVVSNWNEYLNRSGR